MNIAALLDPVVRRRGDHGALIAGTGSERRRVTFGQLAAAVDSATARFRRSPLQTGDRVLLAVPVSIEAYVVMLAAMRAGYVVMFIDPAHRLKTIARCLRLCPPAAIVGSALTLAICGLIPGMPAGVTRFSIRGRRGLIDPTRTTAPERALPRARDDAALLTFTSGSTGEPKPVIRTHGFLAEQIAMLRPVARVRPTDIELVAMPMFVLFNLSQGITSLVPAADVRRPGRADPRVLADQLRQENATRVVASPALVERLAGYCARSGIRLDRLRCVATGGGPVPPTLAKDLQRVAPHAVLRSVYGSTEAEPIATIDNHQVSARDARRMRAGRGLLVGRPVDGCRLRIVDTSGCPGPGPLNAEAFNALEVPGGSVGEIVVSGDHVLHGYADEAFNTSTKIDVDGIRWHRTGDAGYLDNQERLWLVGRVNAVVRDRRGVLYPFQIEYAAAALPGIRRVALLPDRGLRVLAIESDHLDGLAQLARFMAAWGIDRIVRLRRIPLDRRHDAKVDYARLRQLVARPRWSWWFSGQYSVAATSSVSTPA